MQKMELTRDKQNFNSNKNQKSGLAAQMLMNSQLMQKKAKEQKDIFKYHSIEENEIIKLHDNPKNLEPISQLSSKKFNNSNSTLMAEMIFNTPLMQRKAKEQQNIFGNVVQKQENKTGLPDNLKSGMEAVSGVNLDNVKVHYNSPKPALVQAHAFAQGNEIHLASGQEKHLPHELGHVVQQSQGRVQPTTKVGGVAVNDNANLENEATKMGEMALQRKTSNSSSLKSMNSSQTIQRKLIFNAEDTLYQLEGGDEYGYVGNIQDKSLYVKADDLDKMREVATELWTHLKSHPLTKKKNMKDINNVEAKIKLGGNISEEESEFAEGGSKYEEARRKNTEMYLIGSAAPGKNDFKFLVDDGKSWENLNFYYPNNTDDEKVTAMNELSAKNLVKDNYDLFSNMLVGIMVNAGEPLEKSVGGGGMDRASKAVGDLYFEDGAEPDWDSDGNPYKEYIESVNKIKVDDPMEFGGKKDIEGAESFKILDKEVVYVGKGESKARTGKKFYIGGKGYTKEQIVANKDEDLINTPWNTLKAKTPKVQVATSFARKDRGKGQAHAMGGWSANAAVVAKNVKDGTTYDEKLAYEWLHIRGAGLGGATAEGNLVPGTYSANSEMIPIEGKIKTLKSNPDIEPNGLKANFIPKGINGVFANSIEMKIEVQYKGVSEKHTGAWEIDAFRGSVYDKVQDKRLRLDLENKVESLVGKKVDLVLESDGSEIEHTKVLERVGDTQYKIELHNIGTWVIAEKKNNKFEVPNASLAQALQAQALSDSQNNSADTFNYQLYKDLREEYRQGITDAQNDITNNNTLLYNSAQQEYAQGFFDAQKDDSTQNTYAYNSAQQEYRNGYLNAQSGNFMLDTYAFNSAQQEYKQGLDDKGKGDLNTNGTFAYNSAK